MSEKTLHIILLLGLISMFVLSGCKTKQNAVTVSSTHTIDENELISKTIDAQPQFETMNISKMTMSLNYGQYTFNVKGSIRIIADSVVSVSIQPLLGIEMYRMEFQKSGFAVYDKMNRRYSENSYNFIYLKTGIKTNYKVVEALFSHQLFTPQTTDRTELCRAFHIITPGDTATIRSVNTFASMSQQFDITPLYRIASMRVDQERKNIGSITYDKMQEFNNIKFPELIDINVSNFKLPVKARITIEKIVFNKAITTTPIDLSRYTKTSLTDIISFKK